MRRSRRTCGVGRSGAGSAPCSAGSVRRSTYAGGARPVLDIGYFANVVPVAPNLGIAISTDGVGTKLLVAQSRRPLRHGRHRLRRDERQRRALRRRATGRARRLHRRRGGRRRAARTRSVEASPEGASWPASPVRAASSRRCARCCAACVRGARFDLVGTAIGTVALDRVLDGRRRSSRRRPARARERRPALERLHAGAARAARARRARARRARRRARQHARRRAATPDADLRASRCSHVLDAGLPVHALAHITGDGLFNLVRTARPVGFDIERWPEPPPIFALVQRLGGRRRRGDVPRLQHGHRLLRWSSRRRAPTAARAILADAGLAVHVLGRATDDPERTITLRPAGWSAATVASRVSGCASPATGSGDPGPAAPPLRRMSRVASPRRTRQSCMRPMSSPANPSTPASPVAVVLGPARRHNTLDQHAGDAAAEHAEHARGAEREVDAARPRTYGPRSLIVTSTERPLCRLVTRTLRAERQRSDVPPSAPPDRKIVAAGRLAARELRGRSTTRDRWLGCGIVVIDRARSARAGRRHEATTAHATTRRAQKERAGGSLPRPDWARSA